MSLNARLRMLLEAYPDELFLELLVVLREYRDKAQKEVTDSKDRSLVIHNTIRAIYQRQVELIDETLAYLEDGDDIPEAVLFELLDLLDEGEEIIA